MTQLTKTLVRSEPVSTANFHFLPHCEGCVGRYDWETCRTLPSCSETTETTINYYIFTKANNDNPSPT